VTRNWSDRSIAVVIDGDDIRSDRTTGRRQRSREGLARSTPSLRRRTQVPDAPAATASVSGGESPP